VVEIVFVPGPDANSRLRRAFDILLAPVLDALAEGPETDDDHQASGPHDQGGAEAPPTDRASGDGAV